MVEEIKPFFSIIISTYNRSFFLDKAIKSVISQSYKNWELIIVDDGSTDNTNEVVGKYINDSRIKYWYQQNQERCVARNKGIKESQGEYICFLDSDDYFLECHLQNLHDKLSVEGDGRIIYFSKSYIYNVVLNIMEKVKYSIGDECDISSCVLYAPPIHTVAINRMELLKSKILFVDEYLPFAEWSYFVSQMYEYGFKYKELHKYSVVIVHHEKNTTAFTENFVEGKYNFILLMQKKYSLRSQDIQDTLINLRVSLANFKILKKEYIESFYLLIDSVRQKPSIFFTRKFLGVIKKFLL